MQSMEHASKPESGEVPIPAETSQAQSEVVRLQKQQGDICETDTQGTHKEPLRKTGEIALAVQLEAEIAGQVDRAEEVAATPDVLGGER